MDPILIVFDLRAVVANLLRDNGAKVMLNELVGNITTEGM